MAVRKVGTCEVVRELGRGGMGVVYEARQGDLARTVAVKELPAELAKKKEFASRFMQEGRVYAQLRHQAIVTVYDLVEKFDALYLITEYVDGADLAKLMQGGPLPATCVAVIGARVAEALDYVHFHKLLHRDIKPANIMLSRDGEVKLMDFGIAKDQTADDLTRVGLLVGSPSYLAPELLSGERADALCDIWALGVTMYELLAGTKPFQGKDQGSLFATIKRGRYKPLRAVAPHVPRRLALAVERCLKVKAKQRWQSAAELARELELCAGKYLEGFHPQARLVALMTHRGYGQREDQHTAINAEELLLTADIDVPNAPPPPPRRRLWPWAMATLLALAGAGAGAAYFLRAHAGSGLPHGLAPASLSHKSSGAR